MNVSVAVLVGGKSRRMGQEKGLVSLKGRPMIAHTLDRVQRLGLPVMLISRQPELYAQFGLPVYADVLSQRGSLIGLHSALVHSPTIYTLCVACDMPLLNVDLLRHLIALRPDQDVVVPRLADRAEPLHALYHRDCLPAMEAQIAQGDMQISRLYAGLRVRYVEEAEIRRFDPDLHSFTNANTPEELAALEALL